MVPHGVKLIKARQTLSNTNFTTMSNQPLEFTDPDSTIIPVEPTGVADLDLYESSDSDTELTGAPKQTTTQNHPKRPHSQLEDDEPGQDTEHDDPTKREEIEGEGGFLRDELLSPAQNYDPMLSPPPQLTGGLHGPKRKVLSERQQERLLEYFDSEVMRIRRKYVQRFTDPDDIVATPTSETNHNNNRAGGDDQPVKKGYESLAELFEDIVKVIDVIWYSITSSEPSKSSVATPDRANTFVLFGQQHALLTVAAALPDYLSSFISTDAFNPETDAVAVIRTFQKMDQVFSTLIDAPGGLTRTENVRLESIAEVSRVEVVKAFEASGIEGYRREVMGVYENVLDRLA